MCFSATASFVAGGALAVAGVATLAQTKNKKQIPVASMPLLFAAQQGVEGIVWSSFGVPALHTVATYAYTIIANVVWPIVTPLALLAIERDVHRKNMLRALSVIGTALGMYLLYGIMVHPVLSYIVNCSIGYTYYYPYPYPTLALYVLVTCGSCLVSSHRLMNIFGIVLLVSFIIAAWFYIQTFFSVWCFFSAILSGIVYVHVRSK